MSGQRRYLIVRTAFDAAASSSVPFLHQGFSDQPADGKGGSRRVPVKLNASMQQAEAEARQLEFAAREGCAPSWFEDFFEDLTSMSRAEMSDRLGELGFSRQRSRTEKTSICSKL